MKSNKDKKTVDSFGDEWSRFDQSALPEKERETRIDEYFSIFPWDLIQKEATGVDIGCGTGRWSSLAARKASKLICIDASLEALEVAKNNLKEFKNITFIHSSLDALPIEKNSLDFGYSLGVLHHIPDTEEGIKSCVALLKPGAPFLVYLYYKFDNRPFWFKFIWMSSEIFRFFISHLPAPLKNFICDLFAIFLYYPLAKISLIFEKFKLNPRNIPLSYYKDYSFYSMRTDARDRLGTPLERRFTRIEITEMFKNAGLINIKFSDSVPYWCAVGIKA